MMERKIFYEETEIKNQTQSEKLNTHPHSRGKEQ